MDLKCPWTMYCPKGTSSPFLCSRRLCSNQISKLVAVRFSMFSLPSCSKAPTASINKLYDALRGKNSEEGC